MPAMLNNLQHDFFAKVRIAKTRQEWKEELDKCKYVTGISSLPMINGFEVICGKLQLPIGIKKFVRILPMNLRQFVISRAHLTFAEVADSVQTYQELMEVEAVLHIFKNVSLEDVGCSLCHKPHKSLECPSLRFIIEMKVSSSITLTDLSSSSYYTHSRSSTHDYGSRRPRYFDYDNDDNDNDNILFDHRHTN